MDIRSYVAMRKQALKKEITEAGANPHLVIIQANDNPASDIYIRGKITDCQEVGIKATHVKLDASVSQTELLETIRKYNEDESVHGIIVQMPLGKHISEDEVKVTVTPSKDVDGFHPLSTLVTCTPKGIVDYLTYMQFDFTGKNAVVIGRSNIVGKPLAALLTRLNANVTILHSKTTVEDMNFYLKHADLICVAVGKKWFIDQQELRPSAVLVDVGINRIDGVLYGDARPNLAIKLQTPVPGGVGLLTRLALLNNVWEAYRRGI